MIKSTSKLLLGAKVASRNSSCISATRRSRHASNKASAIDQPSLSEKQTQNDTKTPQEVKEKKKTMAEIDEELRLKLEGISGGGGEAGLELEDGQPVAMKRGVKQNMFRLI